MSMDKTVLERVAALEAAVAQIQRELLVLNAPPNWLDRVTGSMKDQPAFLGAMLYGHEFRQSDRPRDEGDEARGSVSSIVCS
jgi:hypothetical protein